MNVSKVTLIHAANEVQGCFEKKKSVQDKFLSYLLIAHAKIPDWLNTVRHRSCNVTFRFANLRENRSKAPTSDELHFAAIQHLDFIKLSPKLADLPHDGFILRAFIIVLVIHEGNAICVIGVEDEACN